MPSFSWKGGTGAWGTPSLWNPAGVPAAVGDTATISVAGPYTVTIAQGDVYALSGIVLGGADAVLAVDGTLDLGAGTIALNDGTLSLGSVAAVANAVFDLHGGTFSSAGGTVTDATFRGPLVFADAMTLAVGGTLTLVDAAGAAPGTIDMAGLNGRLTLLNDITLDAATLSVGGANSVIAIDPSATLTLGAALTATFTASFADVTGELVNNGTLAMGGGGLAYVHEGSRFHNAGLVDITDGQLWVGSTTFDNTGTLLVGSGGQLTVDPSVSIANTGTLSLGTGGTLALAGSYTVPQIEAIGVVPAGGTLQIMGTLDLGGGTLTLDGLFAATALGGNGTIANGTIAPAAGSLTGGGTLAGVTWLGNLDLADGTGFMAIDGLSVAQAGGGTIALGSFSGLFIAGGLTLGNGGSIAMNSDLSLLRFAGGGTLDAVDVTLAGASTGIQSDLGTLTLGAAATLELSGDGVALQGAFVNQGRIALTDGSATIGDFIDPATFANQGTIAVTGGRLVLNDTSFTNAGLIDIGAGGVVSVDTSDRFVNPGTIVVGSGGTLELLDSMTLADLVSGNLEGAGGTLVVGGPLDLQNGTMDIELTPASSVIELIAGGTIVNGTIHVGGGPFLTSGGTLETIIHEGSLAVTAFGSLATQGSLTVTGLDGTGAGTIAVADGGILSLDGSLTLGGGAIELSGSLANLAFGQDMALSDLTVAVTGTQAEIDVSGGTLTIAETARIDLSSDFSYAYGNLLNLGAISLTFGDFTIDDWNPGDGFVNQGSLVVSGGRFAVASDLFANAGTVQIGAGGYLEIDATSSFTSTGLVAIGAAGTLDIGAASAASVDFTGTGRLVLDDAAGYTGTIGGLSIGTSIQLTGQTVLSASILGTTLTADLEGGGTVAYTIDPALPDLVVDIATGDDGLANLLVVLCFRSGTRLETAEGPRAVDALRVGELLRTATGELRPIRWIGKRSFDCARHPDPRAVRPVRIAADAFGPAQPARALFLSPDHAIHAEGVLIPVRYLIDGVAVRQTRAARVTYFHVELDSHDIVLAEGLEVESYLDVGDRHSFDGGVAVRLYPAFGQGPHVELIREAMSCAPLTVTGSAVDAVRAHLARPRRRAV